MRASQTAILPEHADESFILRCTGEFAIMKIKVGLALPDMSKRPFMSRKPMMRQSDLALVMATVALTYASSSCRLIPLGSQYPFHHNGRKSLCPMWPAKVPT